MVVREVQNNDTSAAGDSSVILYFEAFIRAGGADYTTYASNYIGTYLATAAKTFYSEGVGGEMTSLLICREGLNAKGSIQDIDTSHARLELYLLEPL